MRKRILLLVLLPLLVLLTGCFYNGNKRLKEYLSKNSYDYKIYTTHTYSNTAGDHRIEAVTWMNDDYYLVNLQLGLNKGYHYKINQFGQQDDIIYGYVSTNDNKITYLIIIYKTGSKGVKDKIKSLINSVKSDYGYVGIYSVMEFNNDIDVYKQFILSQSCERSQSSFYEYYKKSVKTLESHDNVKSIKEVKNIYKTH